MIDRTLGINAIYDLNPDIILHLGAKSSTDLENVDEAYFLNTKFTNDLIDYSIEKNKKLIYASSAATYGFGENGFTDNSEFKYLQNLSHKIYTVGVNIILICIFLIY